MCPPHFQIQTTANTLTSSYDVSGAQPSNQGVYTCYVTNGFSNASAAIGGAIAR